MRFNLAIIASLATLLPIVMSSPFAPTGPGPEPEVVPLPGYISQVRPGSSLSSVSGKTFVQDDDYNPSYTFNQTCYQMSKGGYGKKGQTTLEGLCRDRNKVWWKTSINLNMCLGNRDGNLTYIEDGNFDQNCFPCIWDYDTSGEGIVFKCNCLKPDGLPQYTDIHMGPFYSHFMSVQARDGRLVCGDKMGNKSPNFVGGDDGSDDGSDDN